MSEENTFNFSEEEKDQLSKYKIVERKKKL